MADGLSIAASVAGLVSLGIQVCSGITTYLDGLKCRAEELEYARQYEQSLKASIQAIESVSPQLLVHHRNSSATIVPCMQLCKDQLEALDRLVAELCGEKKSNPSLRDRAKASKKRLTYAFDRPKLSQLQTKVDQAIQSLQLALQILGLESSSSIDNTLRIIESTSNDTAADITATKAEVTALADDVSTLRNEGPLIRAAIENVGPSLLRLGQTATQTAQSIQVVREDSNRTARMLATEVQLMRSQLAAFQSQNTIAHRTTTRLLQLVRQDQGRLVTQIISRPSYLEEVSEECFDVSPSVRDLWEVDSTRIPVLTMTTRGGGLSDPIIQSRFARKCTCQARHKFQRKQLVWPGFLLYQDNVYSEKHFPTCELWQGTKVTEKKWGLRQVSLGWLAQKAVEITFSCKFGAGGASFGPNFTYYPTVDERVAPAFRTLQIIEDALDDLFEHGYEVRVWQCLLERGFQILDTLFREGRASPNDVNSHNQTLIYPLSQLIWQIMVQLYYRSVFSHRIILDSLEIIKRFEIPSNVYDSNGRSLIHVLTKTFVISSAEAVESFFGKAADIPALSTSSEGPASQWQNSKVFCESISIQMESQLIAEAYDCGQLSQAVLIGNSKQVKQLLQKGHADPMEINCWGQTPLHLSTSQPDILNLLLQVCDSTQLDRADNSGFTAFHYALLSAYSLCRNDIKHRKVCRKCHCAGPMKMLLKADCAVDVGVLQDLNVLVITRRCKRVLLKGLKDRRENLKRLALKHLPDSDIVAFNLRSGRVLDAQTAIVLGLLEANGVRVPPSLRLTQQRGASTPNGLPGVSIYHAIKDVSDANLFWSHGFQDFDEFNGQFDEVQGGGLPLIATCKDGHLIMWFFNHGADLFKELKPSNDNADRNPLCVRTAHFIYRQIGVWLSFKDTIHRQDILSPLHAAVLAVEVLDKCECSCSKQGCTPFLMMVKALNFPFKMKMRRSNIDIVEPFLAFLKLSSYRFPRNQYKEAVRYFTFTALDISHTCHHKPVHHRDYTFTCSATIEMCENAMHIREEQADMIELLEEILFDLDVKLDGMMEDDEDFDMGRFLTEHWLVRVEKELKAISSHKLPEDLKRNTEALGVVWDEAAEETDSVSEDVRDKPLQYWLDAIDRAAQL